MLISKNQITGYIAMWGIRQCSTKVPFEFEKTMLLIDEHFNQSEFFKDAKFGFIEVTDERLHYIVNSIMSVPEFLKWNLTKKQYDAGVSYYDPDREKFQFSSRYDPYVEYDENDFIDLGALIGNVIRSIEKEIEADRLFDEKFEKEHGKLLND